MRFEDPVTKAYRSDEVLAGAPDKRSEPSGSRFDVSGSRPRAAHGRMGPALSGRVAASDEQIREPEQQRDALRVLRQSPVAHLTVPEAPLHIQERMLHLRPHRCLALLGRRLGAVPIEQATLARLHRHLPGDAATPVLRALVHTLAVDEAEDARYGEDARGDELPEELKRREDRLAAIRAAKARLAAEQRAMDDARGRKPGQSRNPKGGKPYKREYGEPDAKAQSNFTDPESRIMKTSSEGFQQCYNAQTVVDGDNQVVVATTVTDSASDQGQLIPMVDAVRDAFGETPEQVLADAGYCSEPNLQALKERDSSTGMCRLVAGKARRSWTPIRTSIPRSARMAKKLATSKRAEDGTHAASGWLEAPRTAGSQEVMGFRSDSASGAWRRSRPNADLVCLALAYVKRLDHDPPAAA